MIIVYVIATLWIVTHVVATEIPVTARAPKPFSCQLCLSGWTCIVLSIATLVLYENLTAATGWMAVWAATVFIEALYQRLHITFM